MLTKKLIKNRIKELKGVAIAAKRMLQFSVANSPVHFFGYLITGLIVAIMPYLNNFVSGKVIDGLVDVVNTQSDDLSDLSRLIIIYITLLTIYNLINWAISFFDTMFWLDMNGKMILLIQKVFANLDIVHHEDHKFKDKIRQVIDSYSFRPPNFLDHLINAFFDISAIAFSFSILILYSPLIASIIFIAVLPEFINNIIFGRKKFGMWSADTEVRRDFWSTTDYLEDQNSLAEIKIFGFKFFIMDKIRTLYYTFFDKEIAHEKKRQLVMSGMTIFSTILFGFTYWMIVKDVLAGTISIGQFTFYVATILGAGNAIRSFLRNITMTYEHGLYVSVIFDVIDEKPRIVNGTNHLPTQKPPLIEFKNVWFRYPHSKHYIFKDLNFTINPGENVAIVGENGAGKTTFVKLLCRFFDINKGEILINGINIKDYDIDNYYKSLALLSQNYVKYHFDAKTNIGLGDIQNIENLEGIIDAAKLSGAHDFISNYKRGYSTRLSKQFKGGIEPSTGQWQKVAIARALFKKPNILILDEPTSAIDPKAESEIFDKLFDYASDKTVIIISHRFSTVRNAEKIIVIDNGQIIEQGSHEELINLNGKYKHAYDLQKRGYED